MRSPYKVRFSHGIIPTVERLDAAAKQVDAANRTHSLPYQFAVTGDTSRFDFLFPQLQTERGLLPESYETRDALVDLGMTMTESDHPAPDSLIPSIYTYFGQFVDHDITLEAKSDKVALLSSKTLRPLTLFEIKSNLVNGRKPGLDLDNVYYKPAARAYSKLLLGTVTLTGEPVARKDQLNDLPRRGPDPEDKYDRAALIGDARNDENLIIAQLHVAFLRAHNVIAAQGHTFDEARKILRQHYQWIIVKDFLPRICDPWIVNSIVNAGNRWFRPDADDLFMPLEFSVAAYRFGHSMVRQRYHVNLNFPAATLADLFELTALSGTLKGQKTLPDAWVVEWENFVEGGANRARPIDTSLTPDLFNLMSFGKPVDPEARLPVRNLLRGYMLRLPTGQAVAEALRLPPLTAAEIEQAAQDVSSDQLTVVRAHGFSTRTPLWYYILAEAAARGYRGRLGPVGSTLVAEVLIGLVRGSKDSILRENNWQPWLGNTPGEFQLSDLLKLAGVINRPPGPTHQGEKVMSTILDNIGRKRTEMSRDKILIGQNVAAGIAAMREGVRSPAWEYYMTQFARDDDGTLDKAKLARLMGSDGTLGDPIMDRKRAYLVANSICGDTTYTFLDYGCDSIDDGINGAVCDRFLSPCIPENQSAGKRTAQNSARKIVRRTAKKKAVKK